MKKLLPVIVLIVLLSPFSSYASNAAAAGNGITISGKVRSAESGEELIRATVSAPELKAGALTNKYGFYSLTLPPGNHQIRVTYVGFKPVERVIDMSSDQTINFELESAMTRAREITVTGERPDVALIQPVTGIEHVPMERIEKVPVLLGEKDVMKTVQLMPGISTVSEGSTGFSVRGGSTDQNLVLLDEATVYSPSHLMGFVSVFNSDALKDVTIYKGGTPARFGGRASSVMELTMNDGNKKKFGATGGIGILASRLTLETPIIKDKMSFIASGRRSYMDLVAKAWPGTDVADDTKFYYYDLNTKLNYEINDENRIFISGYFGQDVFAFEDLVNTDWGNTTLTMRWNHLFSKRLFSNTTLLYSKYNYGFSFNGDMDLTSGIDDISFKEDFTWFANPRNTVRFGVASKQHQFNPGKLTGRNDFNFEIIMQKQKSLESAVYISNEQKLFDDKLTMSYGLRFSMYNQLGADAYVFNYDEDNMKTDSAYYKDWESVETFQNFEPRFSANYRIDEQTSVKFSYNRMSQYLHLLQNATSGQPTDFWMSSSNNIKPLNVDQISAGIFRNFFDNELETSIEFYYKDMKNVTDFENGADIFLNENVEAEVIQGKGKSYGMEVYVKKRFGRLSGWVSYTLARTEQQVDDLNFGKWYPAKQDKTHDFSAVLSYDITDRLSASATWVYYSGNAVTFPSGKYKIDGKTIPYYTERNGYRMPEYHRLDLGLRYNGKKRERYKSYWELSVYNVYNRKNPFLIFFEENPNNPAVDQAVQVSLFGIVPSISYNFSF